MDERDDELNDDLADDFADTEPEDEVDAPFAIPGEAAPPPYSDMEDSDRAAQPLPQIFKRAAPVQRTRRRPPESQAIYQSAPLPAGRGYGCADVITALFLLATVLVISYTILLIANPRSPLNPFPYPTLPPVFVLASPFPTDTPTMTFTPEPFTATP